VLQERLKIQDILFELIHNSMRAKATRINIEIADLGDTVRLTVEDNGEGIEPQKAARLEAALNSGRRDELEILAGADHTRTGLRMVGFMTDKAQLESTPGVGTKIVIYRNKTTDH